MWDAFSRDNLNFYFEIAEYAKKCGRRVQSLEGGAVTTKSRLHLAASFIDNFPYEKAKRIAVLSTVRRDISMQRKIQSKKPKLVVMASGHAAYIHEVMKPTKTIATSKFME